MKIVLGFVSGIDGLPSRARAAGLFNRVAYVLETYRSDKVDVYFDDELYASLIEGVQRVSGADRMSVSLGDREARETGDAREVGTWLAGEPEEEREPFPRIVLKRHGVVVAFVGSEPYARIGGPDPYHDSYTIPVFSHVDMDADLASMGREVCERLGGCVTDVIRGSKTPPSFLKQLIRPFLPW